VYERCRGVEVIKESARSLTHFCYTAWRHIPEDNSLRSHTFDNLKSHCEACAAVAKSFVQLCNLLGNEAGFYLIFLDCLTLKMEAVWSFETSVTAIRHGITSQMIWICRVMTLSWVCRILQWLLFTPHSCVAVACDALQCFQYSYKYTYQSSHTKWMQSPLPVEQKRDTCHSA
jgi:hypothetical protein